MSGWIMWNRPVEVLELVLLISLLVSLNVWADEPPEIALLEFLGEWETEDGEFLDPGELEEMPELSIIEEVQIETVE